MMEAAIGIAVFLNDGDSYDNAMAKYQGRVPAYVYLTQDGSYPKAAPGSERTYNGRSDHQILARPKHLRRWSISRDLPRLHPYRLWHFLHLPCSRNGSHPGH